MLDLFWYHVSCYNIHKNTVVYKQADVFHKQFVNTAGEKISKIDANNEKLFNVADI